MAGTPPKSKMGGLAALICASAKNALLSTAPQLPDGELSAAKSSNIQWQVTCVMLVWTLAKLSTHGTA